MGMFIKNPKINESDFKTNSIILENKTFSKDNKIDILNFETNPPITGIENMQSSANIASSKFIEVESNLWNDFSNSELGQEIIDKFQTALATLYTAKIMMVNATCNILENMVDFVVLLEGIKWSGILNLGTTVKSYLETGEVQQSNDAMNKVLEFVSTEYANDYFINAFTNNKLGAAINDKSLFKVGSDEYKTATAATEFIGEIALTFLSAGGYGAAKAGMRGVTTGAKYLSKAAAKEGAEALGKNMTKQGALLSFVTGTSKGTSNAYNEGATAQESLLYGILNGTWEGGQWLIGGKVAGQGLKTVGIDMLTGAADVPFRSAIEGIYSDNSFSERFAESGGFAAMALNTGFAGLLSGVGELSYFKNILGNNKQNSTTNDLLSSIKESKTKLDMFATDKNVLDNATSNNIAASVSNKPIAKLSFSKKFDESIKQLSDYYGDAGDNINEMFLQGKTAKQILDELGGQDKIEFQNFLQNTRQGRYLASLSEPEIRSMTEYTGNSYSDINGMLRKNKISGTINGMDAQKLIDNMDAAIDKYGGLEVSTELYRAVGVSAITGQGPSYAVLFNDINLSDLNQVYSALKVLEGKYLGDYGYMSTSPAYSASFAKYGEYPIVFDIIADEGTPGAYINQISNYYNAENEFLLARNTVLKIVEVLKPEKDINGLEKIFVRCVVK